MIKFCEAQSPNEGMPPVKVRCVGGVEQQLHISSIIFSWFLLPVADI